MGATLCDLIDAPLDPPPPDGVTDPATQPVDLVELGRDPPDGDLLRPPARRADRGAATDTVLRLRDTESRGDPAAEIKPPR